MPPLWDRNEQNSSVYGEIERPSKGVVTVRYQPPSESDLEKLNKTEIYRIVREKNRASSRISPSV